jgi:DNA topoisomerase-1
VALRLVCEREAAIESFVPQVYWVFGADVRKQEAPLDPFRLRLVKIGGEKAEIRSAEQAEAVRAELEKSRLTVASITDREVNRRAFPPYITSSLQQAASRVFDFTPSRTMRIAQKLYEGVDLGEGPVGLITYMRTDSFALSADAQRGIREFVAQTYGPDYVPEEPNRFRSRAGAQEAHEAIRPTDVLRTPESLAGRLSPEEHRLYSLIWQRAVASQMAPARLKQRMVDVAAAAPGSEKGYTLRASTSELLFPGYMKVSGVDLRNPDREKDAGEGEGEPETDKLPPLREGESLDVLEWLQEQKQTQPPGRYSEASLVKALEENGVGRPSTYASILGTLYDRTYIVKEKRALEPTELGRNVNNLLVTNLNALFEVGFTAEMERELDEVEDGKLTWTGMLDQFYAKFREWLKDARGPGADGTKVTRVLGALDSVKEWAAPTQRGRRTYSDEKFVGSIRKQLEEARKPLSERQLEVLAKLAMRYREQIPGLDALLHELGLEAVVTQHHAAPSSEAALRKLDALQGVSFPEPVARRGGRAFDERKFVESVRGQVTGGRVLSPAQVRVLDRMLLKYAEQIPNFEALKGEIGQAHAGPAEPDHESGPLLAFLGGVRDWKPPRPGKGGKTPVFDDRKFFESLRSQFATRGSLSPRQRSALKRMAARYRKLIEGHGAAETHDDAGAESAG